MISNWMGWFYWDPPREAFFIPFFDHPVVWYGLLFVTGFICAYFIIQPLFVRFINHTPHLSIIEVTEWTLLIDKLHACTLFSSFLLHLDPSAREQLQQKELSPSLKAAIMKGLNQLMNEGSTSRQELQQILSPALTPARQTAFFLTDRLCWFTIVGTVVGARACQVIFYDWSRFHSHPWEIFQIWQGGLASHGGVIGVMLALYLYRCYVKQWFPELTFLRLMDYSAVPSALVACFIRLGNFMNQEILGKPTLLPWGIVFGHPFDGSAPLPRHPVQLYEAGCYLLTFLILWRLWKNNLLRQRLEP